ncbi:hypothetical protein [Winogradskyella aurantiaca]|uniref:hypothetical protein n=1 Tax=Winogradskyella aurantiaca TaxID=2219558 RepID=UPI000E1DD67F|nr:hypothetical protein [Winogradskyella aurantiaca]
MKYLVFWGLASISTLLVQGQNDIEINSLNDKRLIHVLNSSELLDENRDFYLGVRIYAIDNGTASAGFASSEVSHSLLFAITEFDEQPKQSLFEVGPFLNPKFLAWGHQDEQTKEFSIEHGLAKNRQVLYFKASIDAIVEIK